MNLLTLKENPNLLDIPGRVFPPDPLIEVEDEEHFEVKYIKDSRRYHCQIKYLVKWKGYENLNEPIKICGTISTSSMISTKPIRTSHVSDKIYFLLLPLMVKIQNQNADLIELDHKGGDNVRINNPS